MHPFSWVNQSCPTLCNPMDCSMPALPVYCKLLEFNQTHVHWVSYTTQPFSSSVIPFSFCLQSFPASRYFPMSQFFASGPQSIGVSASISVLPMSNPDRFPLWLTVFISLQSKGRSSLLQHHSSKASILQHSTFIMVKLAHLYMNTGKAIAWLYGSLSESDVSAF